jgi:diguanylate cyclase (GGDEF)-like protein
VPTLIRRRVTTGLATEFFPHTLLITVLAAGGFAYGVLSDMPHGVIGAVVAAYMAFVVIGAHRMQTRYGHAVTTAVRAARQDKLTGLATRPVMDDLLCAATRDRVPVTVALADVDGLHAVNATFGHAGGDQYVAEVARRLAHALPTGGTLVRQGGDEFALLVPGTVTAAQLATMIGSALSGPAVISGQRLQPRASVGVHSSTGDAWHALACADAAMYTAKENGGNHILTYDAGRDGIPEPDGTRPATRRRDHKPARYLPIDGIAEPADDHGRPPRRSTSTRLPGRRRIRISWSARESFDATFDEGELTDLAQREQMLGPDGRLDLDALPSLDLGTDLDRLLAEHETPQTSNGVQERQIDGADDLHPPPGTETP